MLTVTHNNISDITNAKTVDKYRTSRYLSNNFCTVLINFQNIAGGNHQNMLFIHTKFCCNACLRFPMFKLSMYRDCIFWM